MIAAAALRPSMLRSIFRLQCGAAAASGSADLSHHQVRSDAVAGADAPVSSAGLQAALDGIQKRPHSARILRADNLFPMEPDGEDECIAHGRLSEGRTFGPKRSLHW